MACIFCLRVVARRSNLLLLPSIVVCAVCAEGLAEMCWREALQRGGVQNRRVVGRDRRDVCKK